MVAALAAFLALWIFWPLCLPGALLARDMVVLPHPAVLSTDTVARNLPQDHVLAFGGMLLDASLLARLIILTALLWGMRAAWKISGVAGMVLLVANPWVVERMLQGHWSLVVAFLLLPVVWLQQRGWPLAVWLAALTPTGAVFAALVRPRPKNLAWVLLCSLPWLVPSISNPPNPSPAGGAMFAPRSEYGGILITLLGGGGIWNGQVVPESRNTALTLLAIAVLLLILPGMRQAPRWLLLLGVGSFLLTLASALAPTHWGQLTATVPGMALFRDSQKLLAFTFLLLIVAARTAPPWRKWAIAFCAFAQVLDAPFAMAAITPLPAPSLPAQHGRVLITDTDSAVVTYRGRTIVDPRTKAYDAIAPGGLVVDGVVVDPPNPQWVAAMNGAPYPTHTPTPWWSVLYMCLLGGYLLQQALKLCPRILPRKLR